jgi:beta-phosphoglucomutase-like phosphatase (HAD superfamily)
VIQALIADVDGTLYRQGPVRKRMAVKLLRQFGRQPADAWKTVRVLRAYRQAQETLRESGEPGSAHRQIAHAALRSGYGEKFVAQCVQRWMETEPLEMLAQALVPGLEAFCVWAAEKNLRLGVLSDYDACAKLRALRVEQHFPVRVCAQEKAVGVFKPNPLGLRIALQRLGVDPADAVYVCDRPEVDGATALAAGVKGIVITSAPAKCPPGVAAAGDWFEVRKLIAALLP